METPTKRRKKSLSLSPLSPVKLSPLSPVKLSSVVTPSPTILEYLNNILVKKQTIENISTEMICNMIGKLPDELIESSLGLFNKMREQGDNSVVYELKDKKLALKIMKNNDKNKREIEFYMYFTENYINFPVIYKDIECTACKIYDDSEDHKEENCLVVLSELYDGSLKSIKNNLSKEEILSMILQIAYACSELETLELVHGDLHTGNILYKNIDKNEILSIYIDHKVYNIKTYGKLWVLWDFGNMSYNGEIIPIIEIKALDTLRTDLHKLFSLINKNYIRDLAYDKNITNTKDLIHYLVDKYPTLVSI